MKQFLNVKNILKKGIIALGIIFLFYMVIPLPSPLFPDDYSLVVKDCRGENLRVFLNKDEQWCFPQEDSSHIPEKLKKAITCYEDKYFYFHLGINPVSIVRAAYQNISNDKIVSGASTITMQLARMLNNGKRTYLNKIYEMLLAQKIELYYSKESILKSYLSHAPFGGNIRGYEAAAHRYFEKSPAELSWAEAAALAVLPNAPGLITPGSRNNLLKEKRDKLLKILFEEGYIDESSLRLSLLEPTISEEYPFRVSAPHLTQRIYNRNKDGHIITTTIDKEIQNYSELITRQHMTSLNREGIRNCAAIVLETKTGKVRSYIGSQDFYDMENDGMVDGVQAWRSSGSILKPFLYALSIDDGILIPETLIKDVPSYFDTFSPQNADTKYNGILPAKEALIRSLNIPAVRLLNTYGIYRFYSFLKNAGVGTLFRTAEDYGLPLIVGGAETNLYEMAMLYRGLANEGRFSNSFFSSGDSAKASITSPQLISSGACYLAMDMIKELKRPGAEFYWMQYQNQKPIAWKTGTSYGSKDAWALGVTPDWTIGVWVGNFDGEGNSNLSGAASAGPMLFDLFNYLSEQGEQKWFQKNEMDFKKVRVCKETGFLAGSNCNATEIIDVPIFMNPLRLCPFHKKIFIDAKNKYTVCSKCWETGYKEKHILSYPADVTYYLKLRGRSQYEVLSHNPECNSVTGLNPLDFLYPVDSAKVWLPRDFDNREQKLIARVAHNTPNKTIFWYLDESYIGTTKNKHEKSISLAQGWHNLYIIDEEGFEDQVRFYIKNSEK